MKIFLLLLTLTTAALAQPSAPIKDSRDGKQYKTVKIGKQIWMAENLRFAIKGSKCYGEGGKTYIMRNSIIDSVTLSNNEVQANCKKYGRLYDWNAAMKVCPSGWHLPSRDEWFALKEFIFQNNAREYVSGIKLRAKNGWNKYNGEDTYGFTALPGGVRLLDGYFANVGTFAYWWTSEVEPNDGGAFAYMMMMRYDEESILHGYDDKLFLYSVRCVRD